MHILVTRPEPEATRMKGLLQARGHQVLVEPMMRVRFDPEAIDTLDGVGTLVATSRNGVRAISRSALIETARQLPLVAVGAGTAQEAINAGFATVLKGAGTVDGLAAVIASVIEPQDGIILHLAGDVLAGDLAGTLEALGYRVMAPVVYRMEAASELSAATCDALADGLIDATVLMSGRTAAIYARLLVKHRLAYAAAAVRHLCLSAAVAAALKPLGRVPTDIAAAPTMAAILLLIDAASQLDN